MMRRYSKNYQMYHDIDWFFTDGSRYFHVASNGGAIPQFIKVYRNNNVDLQYKTVDMPDVTTDIRVIDNTNSLNYSSFAFFAKKGFVSIDKVDDGFDNQNYIVIAQPNDKNIQPDIKDLPKLDDKFRTRITITGLDNKPLW